MNILNVEHVVQHGFPISDDIDDLRQQIGYGARESRKAIAVFLVSYWAIDKNDYYQTRFILKGSTKRRCLAAR